jgi:hypothetical protein
VVREAVLGDGQTLIVSLEAIRPYYSWSAGIWMAGYYSLWLAPNFGSTDILGQANSWKLSAKDERIQKRAEGHFLQRCRYSSS